MGNHTRHIERSLFVVAWLMFPRFVMTQTIRGVEESSTRNADNGRVSLQAEQARMDDDLLEVTIPQLENFYASHKYTVTQVVQWHLARIAKYNGVYRAVQTLDVPGALATAAAEDAAAQKGQQFSARSNVGCSYPYKGKYQCQGPAHYRWLARILHSGS
jgi:hypothetical protein